jgi:hypothetical protein
MNTSDFSTFHEAWITAHAMSVSNQVPSDGVVMSVFDTLIEYPIEHVLGSIQVHSRKSKFAPTPADVVAIIESRTNTKHIGPDEAWGIVLKSFDEAESVVMTQEMLDARCAAWSAWFDGDKIGVRMAFKDTYSRIIESAPSPKWRLIAGWDKSRIEVAVEEAKLLGRLPDEYHANKHSLLGAPAAASVTCSGLIEQAAERTKQSPEARENALSKLKEILSGAADDGIARREKERLEFEVHRQEMLDRVAQKLQETT